MGSLADGVAITGALMSHGNRFKPERVAMYVDRVIGIVGKSWPEMETSLLDDVQKIKAGGDRESLITHAAEAHAELEKALIHGLPDTYPTPTGYVPPKVEPGINVTTTYSAGAGHPGGAGAHYASSPVFARANGEMMLVDRYAPEVRAMMSASPEIDATGATAMLAYIRQGGWDVQAFADDMARLHDAHGMAPRDSFGLVKWARKHQVNVSEFSDEWTKNLVGAKRQKAKTKAYQDAWQTAVNRARTNPDPAANTSAGRA